MESRLKRHLKNFTLIASWITLGALAPTTVYADTDSPSGYEEEIGDAVSSIQRYHTADYDQEYIFVYAESPESALHAYAEQLKNAHSFGAETPFKNAGFVGFFGSREEVEVAARAVSQAGVQKTNATFFQVLNSQHTQQAPRKTTNRAPAAEGSKHFSRIDLLHRFETLKSHYTHEELAHMNAVGDEVLGAQFQRSGKRWLLVGSRTQLAFGGMYAGLAMSSVHSTISLELAGIAGATSGGLQLAIDRFGNFTSKVQKIERWAFNALLRPFGKKWVPPLHSPSSHGANIAKWAAVEFAANWLNRLAGMAGYALDPNAQPIMDGIAHIPDEFKFGQGIEVAGDVTWRTVATQGVYETIILSEFNKRNFPYHVLHTHYTQLLEQGIEDPALREEAKAIRIACEHLASKERLIRAGLFNIGTASWIMALALKSNPNPIYSQIASWSLLGVGGALKTYYGFRDKMEERMIGKLNDEVSENVEKSLWARMRQSCKNTMKSLSQWKETVSAQIVPLEELEVSP